MLEPVNQVTTIFFLLALIPNCRPLFLEILGILLLVVLIFLQDLVARLLVDSHGSFIATEDSLKLGMIQHCFARLLDNLVFAVDKTLRICDTLSIDEIVLVQLAVSTLSIAKPERKQANDHVADLPGRIPTLLVHRADGHANAVVLVEVETAILGDHENLRRLGRVFIRALDAAEVKATLEAGHFESKNDVVPVVRVLRIGQADKVVGDLAVLLDLRIDVFLRHTRLSVEPHQAGVCLGH